MRRHAWLPALLLAAGPAGALADDTMFGLAASHERVERVDYREHTVLEIGAVRDQPFMIEFAADETIEEVAGGTIADWEVHKKGARLFVLARARSRYTTLLVTTRLRSYVFDLVLRPATADNLARRRSKIVVMPAPPPAPVPAAAEAPLAAAAAVIQAESSPRSRNEQYTMQVVSASANIRPAEVYDDGRFTWFRFPHNVEVPAIYRGTPGVRDEMLVNRHVDGDYVVMHAVAAQWNLRLGGALVGIFNERHDRHGAAPHDGTTVPGLVRESRK